MLWKKELNSDLCIDLLDNYKYSQDDRRIHRMKNNATSQSLRMEGNRKYSEKDFNGAWIKYNESACFAESGSENLALAYANRSICFLKLELYNRCLFDIELAKDANYPKQSMAKLESRKRECIQKLQSSVQNPKIKTALSFEPDKKLPSMASVVEIETNKIYGRLVKAKCDLQIGQTILIEEEYIRSVECDANNLCTNCGKELMNFVPCKNCAGATFCCAECSNNNFHETECDMMLGSDDICDGRSLTFILRSIVIGINTFSNIDEMMKNVESWLCTSPCEISESCESSQSKYRTFLKLAAYISNERIFGFRKIAFFVFQSIMKSSKLAYKFHTTASKRFLTHLIFHHGMILDTNSFSLEDDEIFIHKLALLTSYINHSCLPNVTKMTKGNVSIIKTILPIQQGEQLFLTYIHGTAFDMTGKERNDFLEKTYGFRCKCTLCTHGRLQAGCLDNDPSFVYVSSNVMDDNFVSGNVANIIQHCIEFLLRHPTMTGSKEVAYIANVLAAMFLKELNW